MRESAIEQVLREDAEQAYAKRSEECRAEALQHIEWANHYLRRYHLGVGDHCIDEAEKRIRNARYYLKEAQRVERLSSGKYGQGDREYTESIQEKEQ
jgi:hypothetical protein